MNADNRGEGGVMALMSLIHPGHERMRKSRRLLVMIGLFGLPSCTATAWLPGLFRY